MCLALKDLTANQEKRKYLAVNGLSYINKFSVANIAQQWEDLFSKFK